MFSTEHRLQTLLGLQFSSTKRYFIAIRFPLHCAYRSLFTIHCLVQSLCITLAKIQISCLRAQSSLAATIPSSQAKSSPQSKPAPTSAVTMTATFHSSASIGNMLINSPPISSRPTPPVLRKTKSYAAQGSDSIIIGSPKPNRGKCGS